ncbi:MAG: hypothetical protein DHS20C07_29920 [Methyloligella sp.]|nr:MAG: hypothetical protein DHS20C07_29920 [Methyloligella sp.]
MKPLVFISALAFSAASAFGVSEVFAFQETEIVVTEQPLVSGSIKKSKSEFNAPKSVVSGEDERMSIRIPGFGVVGTVPKLNFGLELLYRDEEETGIVGQSEADDLSIKGTLKHKF